MRSLCGGGGGDWKLRDGKWGGGWFLPVAGGLVGFDQVTKLWVEGTMKLGLEMPVLPGLFSLTRVHNTGVAFGVGQGNNVVTGLLACGILMLAAWIARSWDWQKRWVQGVAGLIAGGAIGNLIDRARLGYVLDFLDFHYGKWSWPAFNVADAAISLGVGLVVLAWMTGKPMEKK